MIPRLFLLLSCLFSIVYSTISSRCFGELELDLPVRYLHVQLVEHGLNLTSSKGPIDVRFTKGDECRFAQEVVDRFDGSYIIRIRQWTTCKSIHIDVSFRGTALCGGTVKIERENNVIPQEGCYCGKLPSTGKWIEKGRCEKEPQLEDDLKQWKKIDIQKMVKRAEAEWGGEGNRYSTSLCRYKIIDNQIYRQCYGAYVDFKSFMDETLLSLSSKMRLPDCEFLMNLGDYPLQFKRGTSDPVPIVSWCGSDETTDIVVPTYDLTNSVIQAMSRISMDTQTVKGRDGGVRWVEKKDTAVFRGRDSTQLRLKVAKLAEERPDLIEGGITRYFFFNESTNPKIVPSKPFYDFFKHKYIVSIDGTVAAYRMPYLMAGDSLILKSDSKYYEHFYRRMEPYSHYIPFNENNLEEQIVKSRRINHKEYIEDMNRLFHDHLQPRNVFCYYARFFEAYSRRLINLSRDVSGMEKIVPSSPGKCDCGKTDKEEL